MTELQNLFNKDELFLLKKIGIEFYEKDIRVLNQGRKQKIIRTHKIKNVERITFYKTNRRKFSWLSIFNLFNQNIMMEADEHASQIYCLKFSLKNGGISQTDIENFDLIRISKLLERLNAQLKSQN
jgi:hypothetical protein